MKYTDESKALASVRVLSNEIGRRIRKRAKKRQEIDVRPLDQREKPLNNRKGIVKTLIVPRGMTGEQLAFWKLTQDPQPDLEPEYIKKYKSIMQ